MLSVCEDWRFSQKVPITAALQWLEGRKFGVDVKGEDPNAFEYGPPRLYSSNRDNENCTWERIDIEAFRERCYVATLKTRIPDNYRVETGDKAAKCPFCVLRALAKFVPFVACL